MSARLEGKVALVTGAAQRHRGGDRAPVRGGGRRRARHRRRRGGRPAGRGRAGRVRRAATTSPSEAAWADVARWASDQHGRVDVLVNNAGVFLAAPLSETTLEDFRRVQEVNQVGVFLGMRTIAPLMAERGGGSIINLSSVAGRVGSPYLTAYAAGKWAVRGMTKCVAKELAAAGVRVNSLHPGQIDTDMNARQRERRRS